MPINTIDASTFADAVATTLSWLSVSKEALAAPSIWIGSVAWGYLVFETVRKVSEYINTQRDALVGEPPTEREGHDWIFERKLAFETDWRPWNLAAMFFVFVNTIGFLLLSAAGWLSREYFVGIMAGLYCTLSCFGLISFARGHSKDRAFIKRRLAVLSAASTCQGNYLTSIRVVAARHGRANRHFRRIHNYIGTVRTRMLDERLREESALLRSSKDFVGNNYQLFVAYVDEHPVGRMSVQILASSETPAPQLSKALFGFFESVESPRVAKALLEAALGFAHGFGCTAIEGPYSWNANGRAGIQVSGHGDDNYPLVADNPPYYRLILEAAGARLAYKGQSWRYWVSELALKTRERAAKLGIQEHDVEIVPQQPKHFRIESDINDMFAVVNESFAGRPGFQRITPKQVRSFMRRATPAFDPNISLTLKLNGQTTPSSVVIALPNYLEEDARHSKLLAWIFQRIRWVQYHLDGHLGCEFTGRRPQRNGGYQLGGGRASARVMYIATVQHPGLWAYSMARLHKQALVQQYSKIDFTMSLESDEALNKSLVSLGAYPYKQYVFLSYPASPTGIATSPHVG